MALFATVDAFKGMHRILESFCTLVDQEDMTFEQLFEAAVANNRRGLDLTTFIGNNGSLDTATISLYLGVPETPNGRLLCDSLHNGLSMKVVATLKVLNATYVRFSFPRDSRTLRNIPAEGRNVNAVLNAARNATNHLPAKKAERNSKDELFNAIREHLKNEGLGWKHDEVDDTGTRFINKLYEAYYFTDPFREHFTTMHGAGMQWLREMERRLTTRRYPSFRKNRFTQSVTAIHANPSAKLTRR